MIPETPITFWQYFDLVSLIPIFIGVLWILIAHRRAEGSYLHTISRVIAQSPKSQLGFSVLMTLFFPLYYAFLWFWVGPYVNAPTLFYAVLILSAIAEILFIWLPATGKGAKSKIHSVTAAFVGSMMFLAPLLLLTGTPSDIGRTAIISFYVVSGVLGIIYLSGKARRHTLLLEAIFCVAFLAMISIVAHT